MTDLDLIMSMGKNGSASLDRIDSKKGYTEENVQWIHKDVNSMKMDYNEDYFIKMCQLIVEKNSKKNLEIYNVKI